MTTLLMASGIFKTCLLPTAGFQIAAKPSTNRLVSPDSFLHSSSSNYQDNRNVPKLEEWAFNQGIDFSQGIRLVNNGMGDWGVGLTESQSLEAGSSIMTVPSHLILSSLDDSVQEYEESVRNSMAESNMNYYTQECLLMIRVLQEHEKGETSIWKEWLDTLPRDYSTGLYLDPLERSVAQRVAGPFLEHQEQQWEACRKAITNLDLDLLEEFDDDDLLWAFSVVFTRSWRAPTEAMEATLVPLGDMFNHDSSKPNVKPNRLEDGSIQMTAKSGISEGSPLFLSYGHGAFPGRFLVNFGFWDRSCDYMDANLTVPEGLDVDSSQLVVSTRTGDIAEDVFTVAVYEFLKQRDADLANKMLADPDAYTIAYDLEGALWLRMHALKMVSETYPEMNIAPENLSESPRRYGMIARFNNGMRDSWLRVTKNLELDIEHAMTRRQTEAQEAKKNE